MIETELSRIRAKENPGRTRTIARRIAGIALQQLYHQPSEDFLRLLQKASVDDSIPDDVRSAVGRLAARLDAGFTSPSIDPVGDAMLVVDFVKNISNSID